jgi:hypothetical protein
MVYAEDLKSPVERHAGSNPASGTRHHKFRSEKLMLLVEARAEGEFDRVLKNRTIAL